VIAGCTAVVALAVGTTLYVANAGDSRGVLCRGGEAYALSEDHKPQQVSMVVMPFCAHLTYCVLCTAGKGVVADHQSWWVCQLRRQN